MNREFPPEIEALAEAMYCVARPITIEYEGRDIVEWSEASDVARHQWLTAASIAWQLGARAPGYAANAA